MELVDETLAAIEAVMHDAPAPVAAEVLGHRRPWLSSALFDDVETSTSASVNANSKIGAALA